MSRFYLLLLCAFLCVTALTPDVSAQDGEIDYGMYDRMVEVNGYKFRVRRIPQPDFMHLHSYHNSRTEPKRVIAGIQEIEKSLPGFKFVEKNDAETWKIVDFEKRHIHHNADFSDFRYYPDEDVLIYMIGHAGDYATSMVSGEAVTYDPGITEWSDDRKYRSTAMYDGWADLELHLEKLDPGTGQYIFMASIGEITGAGYSLQDIFWVGHKLYFRHEERCFCIIMQD